LSNLIQTKASMLRAGYKFLGNAKCKGCGVAIEWWRTTNGSKLPYDPLPADEHAKVKPHWATCPNASAFKAGGTEAKGSNDLAACKRYLEAFLRSSNARVIVAIYDEGAVASWRPKLPGEDLRHELITEANNIRNHVEKEQA
jgi:hypothetical protein